MKPPYAIGSVPSLSGHAIAYRWRSLPRVRRHRASKPQGSSERVLPWQITMDQLIFASLSHTHYWYEVGMLKVPACTAVCIGLYTRYQYIFYLGTVHSCTVHCCCIMCIYICVTTAVCVCRTMFVCMALTTGQGCQSCSWSAAEQGK